MLPIWITAACATMLLSECRQDNDITTPRRQAYPRIQLLDTTYCNQQRLPLKLAVNSATNVSISNNKSSTWINISYPTYKATIYCTYTPAIPNTISSMIDNRMERIALDLGDSFYENTTINNPNGTVANIYSTTSNMVTPIMFLATDKKSWVLSGAMTFDSNTIVDYDSVAPVINAVKRDLIYTLQNIDKQ